MRVTHGDDNSLGGVSTPARTKAFIGHPGLRSLGTVTPTLKINCTERVIARSYFYMPGLREAGAGLPGWTKGLCITLTLKRGTSLPRACLTSAFLIE